MSGFASKLVSFTPGFSPVERHFTFVRNRFNGFHSQSGRKPLETVLYQGLSSITGLKPGVNKRSFEEQLV